MFGCPPLRVPDSSSLPSEEEEKEEVCFSEDPIAIDADNIADPGFGDDDFNAIPVIDLSQPKNIYAQQIRDACRNVGFFYIINHGVDQGLMDGVMDKSKKFFELDLESKLEVSNRSGAGNGRKKGYRGYFGIGGEDLENKDGTRDLRAEEGIGPVQNDSTGGQKPAAGDFKEGFDCGLECGDLNDARIKFFGENLWPDELNKSSIVGFRATLTKYQAELI